MIPQAGRSLADLAMKLAGDIAPATQTEYAAANAGLMAMLLLALAQEHERAAAVRTMDIDEMKLLFRAAQNEHPEAPGAGQRASYCEREPKSLLLSDLDRFHGEGLQALIALHAWAEAEDAGLDRRIWDFLLRHTERHKFELPPL
ncbi:MAG: hypothetical protein EA417_10835 [Gammaproteobacteria bacterium]|nr:MAG: hypothetical protein EA417_10835 [Gammaproteobacteria bacterium]